jgi:hypothetical protein
MVVECEAEEEARAKEGARLFADEGADGDLESHNADEGVDADLFGDGGETEP